MRAFDYLRRIRTSNKFDNKIKENKLYVGMYIYIFSNEMNLIIFTPSWKERKKDKRMYEMIIIDSLLIQIRYINPF